MLTCCNCHFRAIFSYVLNNSKDYYRRIEFGHCPKCSTPFFRDYVQFKDGAEIVKDYKNKEATKNYEKWQKKLKAQKYCSFSNQNVYYGDFKKRGKKLIQLRKNFNNQSEILGEVKTRIYYG